MCFNKLYFAITFSGKEFTSKHLLFYFIYFIVIFAYLCEPVCFVLHLLSSIEILLPASVLLGMKY